MIALAAAGCFGALPLLYQRLIVSLEVAEEIRVGGKHRIGVSELDSSPWLDIQIGNAAVPAYLANSLDRGQVAVIATALDHGIRLVCIDEAVGRRMARLAGLELTGSLGILVKPKRRGFPVVIANAVQRMREQGIWLSAQVTASALAAAGKV